MARVCSHIDPELPDDVCMKCQYPCAPRLSTIKSSWGVEINGTYFKRSSMPELTNRQLQLLTEGNIVWVVAPNGIKISPLVM